nr:YjzD family protein [uncultured Ligilactobacillus sp.]
MAKQLTILFWCLIYGEVFGYIISALDGASFDPVMSGVFPMIAGWILVNIISLFIKAPKTKENNKSK